jgi:hypothetical protein
MRPKRQVVHANNQFIFLRCPWINHAQTVKNTLTTSAVDAILKVHFDNYKNFATLNISDIKPFTLSHTNMHENTSKEGTKKFLDG